MIGTMLGNRYELLEKIGEGGMALVYKAKCHLLNRYVAVKILKEQYSDDKEFVEKFKREATAVASLSDNNIVNIYDVGTQGDINYIVMEYVNGKTLKQIIREQGKIPTAKTANLAIQIARALDCAHRNNIIHRDIKPQNILVTNEGVVKVTDFGIAKASNSVTITNSSKVMGSAHYFSPEQARGSFVDCRTDIYSLGIVIYEMCTGRVPYDADSPVSVALKHIQEPVIPPKQLNENIPDNLNKLILKAVEKEPIKRYQTIKDMLTDLRKNKKIIRKLIFLLVILMKT
ncbi:serine/threonine protein kinase [Clostridium carboxidivorans P7]|uniref:non-specific serine/threonine protein kinase n=1 Tax=Clostridium carboxidivorans P7 TaxID=536227 RepID=C6PUW3_9CLOT|nr:Stk1 family PASTA domain-containing Ser/Thr kinase [Clostridium carboxidivorans]EET86940.1 serine/threonine protein kinase [Clostridium carboxidivorans P7]